MREHPTRRGYFWSSLGGGLLGALLAGVLLLSMLPAKAATNDPVILGKVNLAGRATTIRSKAPSTLKLVNTRGPNGLALDLVTSAGVPPLRVNRAAWVQNLNADLLDDRQAHQLIRVAREATADTPDPDGTKVSTTIEAPRRGLLVVQGWFTEVGFGDNTCLIAVDGTYPHPHTNSGVGDGSYGTYTCATGGVVPVAAGQHTIRLRGFG